MSDERVATDAERMKLDTDTKYKAVNYIETYTGRAFFPLDPKAKDVTIIDIAHHLSNQCRYSGATGMFYSTAQHCVLLTDYVQKLGGSPLDCLQILMHDAAEAYLIDMPRPVKQHMPEFREWDRAIQMCIREWLGLRETPIPAWQDDLDSRIIVDERAQIMSDSGNDWGHDLVPLGIEIVPWQPWQAEQQFLIRYAVQSKQVYGTHQYLRAGWGLPTGSVFKEFPFKTLASDIDQYGATDPRMITDLRQVDIRGGCGQVHFRSPDGRIVRDTRAGKFPRPAWRWLHGSFELATPEIEKVGVSAVQESVE